MEAVSQKSAVYEIYGRIEGFSENKELTRELNPIYIAGAKKIAKYCLKDFREQGIIINDTMIKRISAAALYEMKK